MRENIARTLGDVFWSDLAAHVARDAVIIAATELDLVDVGMALATNDTLTVDAWLSAGKLQKPTAEDVTRWSISTNLRFCAVVVRPFVLIHRPVLPAPN